MRKKFSLIMAIVCFTIVGLCVAGFYNEAYSAEPMKVIGKATIPAGQSLGGMAQVAPGAFTQFEFVSFEKQDVYITLYVEEVLNTDGSVKIPAGYLLDAAGFKHMCPHHGLETMDGGMIGLPDSQVEATAITVKLFPVQPTE